MLDDLVLYATQVSELSKDNSLLRSVVFRKDSWHDAMINPQDMNECIEFLLTKLFM